MWNESKEKQQIFIESKSKLVLQNSRHPYFTTDNGIYVNSNKHTVDYVWCAKSLIKKFQCPHVAIHADLSLQISLEVVGQREGENNESFLLGYGSNELVTHVKRIKVA